MSKWRQRTRYPMDEGQLRPNGMDKAPRLFSGRRYSPRPQSHRLRPARVPTALSSAAAREGRYSSRMRPPFAPSGGSTLPMKCLVLVGGTVPSCAPCRRTRSRDRSDSGGRRRRSGAALQALPPSSERGRSRMSFHEMNSTYGRLLSVDRMKRIYDGVSFTMDYLADSMMRALGYLEEQGLPSTSVRGPPARPSGFTATKKAASDHRRRRSSRDLTARSSDGSRPSQGSRRGSECAALL